MSKTTETKLVSKILPLQTHPAASLDIQYHKPSTPNTSMPTVILLPFWGGSASTFEGLQIKLSEIDASYTTVAVSYRGTGSSSRSEEDSPQRHDIHALAADVLALLDVLVRDEDEGSNLLPSGKVVFCAHSMSAKVAWEVLSRLDLGDQTHALGVAGLLLLAPAPIGPLELPPEMREQQLGAYASMESARWTLSNILTRKTPDKEFLNGLARDCVGMSSGAKRGWIELGMKSDCTDAVRKVADNLVTNKSLKDFPVVVLAGEHDVVETVDKVKKETVDVLAKLGFVADMSVIAGVGHLLPVEAAGEVAEELSKLMRNEHA